MTAAQTASVKTAPLYCRHNGAEATRHIYLARVGPAFGDTRESLAKLLEHLQLQERQSQLSCSFRTVDSARAAFSALSEPDSARFSLLPRRVLFVKYAATKSHDRDAFR